MLFKTIFVNAIYLYCMSICRNTNLLSTFSLLGQFHVGNECSEIYTLQFLRTIESYNLHCHLPFLLKPLLFLFFSLKVIRREISLMLCLACWADYVFTVIFLYERSK